MSMNTVHVEDQCQRDSWVAWAALVAPVAPLAWVACALPRGALCCPAFSFGPSFGRHGPRAGPTSAGIAAGLDSRTQAGPISAIAGMDSARFGSAFGESGGRRRPT